MATTFESAFFIANRRRLREAVESELIILTANGILQRNADNTFPFRQDSSFWYVTGINDPDIILVMDGTEEYLMVPERDFVREAFDGRLDKNHFIKTSGVKKVVTAAAGWELLKDRLKKTKRLATLLPADPFLERHGFYSNPARATMVRRLQKLQRALDLEDVRLIMARQRMTKQPVELETIQKAIDITVDTILDVAANRHKYRYEYEIESDINCGFRKRGADGWSFPSMVATGANAAQIHHMDNNSKIGKRDLLIMDVGAEVDNYAADITRTIALGPPTRRQQALYDAVLAVREYALSLLKPGITLREYENLVEARMGDELKKLQLIKTASRKNIRHYYPHATSHFLGLDVHDAGDYDLPLAPNMTLALEPGIYIPKEGLGVRIEDDILITARGCRNLSERLPRTLV